MTSYTSSTTSENYDEFDSEAMDFAVSLGMVDMATFSKSVSEIAGDQSRRVTSWRVIG